MSDHEVKRTFKTFILRFVKTFSEEENISKVDKIDCQKRWQILKLDGTVSLNVRKSNPIIEFTQELQHWRFYQRYLFIHNSPGRELCRRTQVHFNVNERAYHLHI